MTDTPSHIKQLQLKIWLSKSPMERLKQMMEDNEALMKFWKTTKKSETKPFLSNETNNPSISH